VGSRQPRRYFQPVGLKKLPFIASSDFHKPKHIHSWKTLLYCEKEAEAIKRCIRVNRDVSLTLYRDHRFGRGLPELQSSIRWSGTSALLAQSGAITSSGFSSRSAS
jgi:hypothetical protein